jgi:hypothetical protein
MALLAVKGLVHNIAGIKQRVSNLPVQIHIIFDDEHTH